MSVDPSQPPDETEEKEMNAHLTDEDKERIAQLEASETPMLLELKHLEKRWTSKGRMYITEPKEDEELPANKINWHEKFALCVTRHYDQQNKHVERTTLRINSLVLKDLLAKIIGSSYPGQNFWTNQVTVDFPCHSLFHYRDELRAALADQEPGSAAAAHLPILLDFINEEFEDVIRDSTNLRSQGLVSYVNLWTIFKPGSLIFSSNLGQPCVFKLHSYNYDRGDAPALELIGHFVDYDGEDFGTREHTFKVDQFPGVKSIANLSAIPLQMHPRHEAVLETLTARGRKWESLAGQHLRAYTGIALDVAGARYNINGQIMVDTHTFHRIEADEAFDLDEEFPRLPVASDEEGNSAKRNLALETEDWDLVSEGGAAKAKPTLAPLTDEQCLMASALVRGFSFTEKKFLEFAVDKIREIEWNSECFEQLVLPNQQKELVQALVAEHIQRATAVGAGTRDFDDIIKGKGQGLILVLHGPPGVGKTLTAECVAEFSRRPLYMVSSGDLSNTPSELDEQLARTLDLASTWNAVLLIDEADVFLERRSLHDMERNGLVSIFLRTLEYYSGILFMTTNRVRTFDEAFKSRIHVPLKYDELPAESRFRVWKNFLGRIEGGADISEASCRSLAEARLNGRQIKNIVRTAKSLANYKGNRLDYHQLRQVMDIQIKFEADLDTTGKDDREIDAVER
ncbi:AAA family ATPase [Lasiosphaeria ovina]|uniref:AAA family ATPase n=1 Tax=Lasiosphaeria ovina TaxID=92902 RepID=A0AAE0N712_9PEZI|nr:AAA family ATPase [Lasiosphaeria ovina]